MQISKNRILLPLMIGEGEGAMSSELLWNSKPRQSNPIIPRSTCNHPTNEQLDGFLTKLQIPRMQPHPPNTPTDETAGGVGVHCIARVTNLVSVGLSLSRRPTATACVEPN
jgi:hypothetical protein